MMRDKITMKRISSRGSEREPEKCGEIDTERGWHYGPDSGSNARQLFACTDMDSLDTANTSIPSEK